MDYKSKAKYCRNMADRWEAVKGWGMADILDELSKAYTMLDCAEERSNILLSRAEAAEARCKELEERANRWEAEVKAYDEIDLAKAHEALSADWAKQKKRAEEAEARAEKAERERDEALEAICTHCTDFPCRQNECPWWRGAKEE